MDIAIPDMITEFKRNYFMYGESVYILQDEARTQIGRIIVPDEALEKTITGTVIGIGPAVDFEGEHKHLKSLELGQRVVFNKYATQVLGVTVESGEVVDIMRMNVNNLYLGWKE